MKQEYSPYVLRLLEEHYYASTETAPEEAYLRAAKAYCDPYGDTDLAKRVADYASRGWFMFSSPILSNAPAAGASAPRALPISCFLSYVPDDIKGLVANEAELRFLSVAGGGVGTHWSDVRSIGQPTTKGGRTPGIIPFIHCSDSAMLAYHQGQTRRGSCAAYLDVSHPELLEFLDMRNPSGDLNRKNLNLHHGVNITNGFIGAVVSDSVWNFVDPHSGDIVSTIPARELWSKLIEQRFKTGEPYLNFIDRANDDLHPYLKDKGLKIHGSNLCNEIHLPTSKDRTAVCCLSSVNLERYDDWSKTNMVRDLVRFLDNVLQYFIDHAGPELQRATYSAISERSLGLGAMGFHSYLQRKMVPFESATAVGINRRMFNDIKEQALEETIALAAERGCPPDLRGSGVRNAHLLAIAPNANSSLILGCSPSIEPWKANAFEQTTRVGSLFHRNVYLEKLLQERGLNNKATWDSILEHQGSVQHLELDPVHKDVFKTANEIDQHWVVQHASDRQQYICQGQSLNLFFPRGADVNYVNSVHLKAARSAVKGLYYLRTDGKLADNINQPVIRVPLQDDEECLACEG